MLQLSCPNACKSFSITKKQEDSGEPVNCPSCGWSIPVAEFTLRSVSDTPTAVEPPPEQTDPEELVAEEERESNATMGRDTEEDDDE